MGLELLESCQSKIVDNFSNPNVPLNALFKMHKRPINLIKMKKLKNTNTGTLHKMTIQTIIYVFDSNAAK